MADHKGKHENSSGGFRKSRATTILIAFFAIAGLLLIYEHRVHLFTGNQVLLGLLAVCAVMVLFIIVISRGENKPSN